MERVKLAGFGRNGFIQDVAEYDAPPESFSEVRNARFNSIGAVAFSGHKSVLSPAPINPLWLRVFPPVDRPLWVYANQSRVYAFDDGHIDITRLSGPYAGLASERWQGEVLNGVGIFNNTVDIPQMWTSFSASVPLQDLTNWPTTLRCKFLRPHKYYLIAGYLIDSGNERPFRVRWSHPADPGTVPASWAINDPTVDSGEFDIAETDDYVVDGWTLGEAFMVYKQKNAYLMYPTGDQKIFGQRLVIPGRGALTRDCIRPIPGGHFVAGLDDLYVHSGQKGSEQSVVEAKLRNWIFNQIDASNFFNCFCVEYKRLNEIWFCFPEAGETYATIAVVFNTLTGGIGVRDLQASPFIWPGPVDERTDDGDVWDPATAIDSVGALLAPASRIQGTAFKNTNFGGLIAPKATVSGTGTTDTGAVFVAGKSDVSTAAVMYSTDGQTWTMATTPASMGVQGMAYAPALGILVAVGGNLVFTSSNKGQTWTQRVPAASANWKDVAWSPSLGLFVAVCNNSTNGAMTSPDGINWTIQTTPNRQWSSVAWSSVLGMFAAGCIAPPDNQTIMTSPDGVTWTYRVAAVYYNPAIGFSSYRMAADPTGYFVASDRGTFGYLKSTDGVTWTCTATGLGGAAYTNVETDGGGKIILARSTTSKFARSLNDGSTWADTVNGAFCEGLAYSADLGLWVGVCNANAAAGKKAIYSSDGTNWSDGTTPAAADTLPSWDCVIRIE